MNWNTLLITVGLGMFSWAARELYAETRATHDAVIRLQLVTVPRQEFDLEMGAMKIRMAGIEIEIQKLKEKN